jgi:dGTPase
MINDLQETAALNIQKNNIDSVEKVRNFKGKIIQFSPAMKKKYMEMRAFLIREFYTHEQVAKEIDKGKKIIKDLFDFYINKPEKLPKKYNLLKESGEELHIVVKDYVAGMTDNFAEEKWQQITANKI